MSIRHIPAHCVYVNRSIRQCHFTEKTEITTPSKLSNQNIHLIFCYLFSKKRRKVQSCANTEDIGQDQRRPTVREDLQAVRMDGWPTCSMEAAGPYTCDVRGVTCSVRRHGQRSYYQTSEVREAFQKGWSEVA